MTQRGDRTKARLILATTELVAEVGHPRVTTRTIAARAGVSEATIYRHFPDKRALFMAALLEGHRPLTQWMNEFPGRAGTSTLSDNLTTCLALLSGLKDSVLPLERALLDDPELGRVRPAGNPLLTMESVGGPPHQLEQYLAAEQRLGRVAAGIDTTEAATALLALLFGFVTGPPLPGRSLEQSLAGAVDLFLHGIETRPS